MRISDARKLNDAFYLEGLLNPLNGYPINSIPTTSFGVLNANTPQNILTIIAPTADQECLMHVLCKSGGVKMTGLICIVLFVLIVVALCEIAKWGY